MDLQERIDKALELKGKGYNCAQCVGMVFDADLEAVAGALGSGVAGTGNICGAASAMALVTSKLTYAGPAGKQQLNARVRGLLEEFAKRNNGETNCRDLRKPGRKSCSELIADAVTILHENL